MYMCRQNQIISTITYDTNCAPFYLLFTLRTKLFVPSGRGKTANTDLFGSFGLVGLFGLFGLFGLGFASLVGPFRGQSHSFLSATLWFSVFGGLLFQIPDHLCDLFDFRRIGIFGLEAGIPSVAEGFQSVDSCVAHWALLAFDP